jgi:hypothetical protein
MTTPAAWGAALGQEGRARANSGATILVARGTHDRGQTV